jgi:hypothetical protein
VLGMARVTVTAAHRVSSYSNQEGVVTVTEADEMTSLAATNFICAICQRIDRAQSMSVEKLHKTLRVFSFYRIDDLAMLTMVGAAMIGVAEEDCTIRIRLIPCDGDEPRELRRSCFIKKDKVKLSIKSYELDDVVPLLSTHHRIEKEAHSLGIPLRHQGQAPIHRHRLQG